uniref:Leucine zipper tumor suppressor 2 n=1 Tax=Angiostrongylus cantonensis TaxID=6313 RepID=A0A0K0DMF4_ANGCA
LISVGSSISDYGSYHNVRQQSKAPSSTLSSGTHSSGSQLPSPPSTAKVRCEQNKDSEFLLIKKKAYPPSGRVSALHVTPSPSDSGIVDYETLIRDKENELRVVRNTMEQNEEIIVKVYQEKERAWKEELEHLRSRLSASEKGENALRAQLAGCQKQTDTMNRTIDGLRDEKTGLLRKCFQLERELMQLKMEMNKPRECEECRQRTHSGPPLKRSLPDLNKCTPTRSSC